MILIDSNLVIYGTSPDHLVVREFIRRYKPSVSAVSYVETLGYHGIGLTEERALHRFFRSTKVFPVDDPVLWEAVRLRQIRKMSLGDALIAGTALIHGLTLATCNLRDFDWIVGLRIVNPMANN